MNWLSECCGYRWVEETEVFDAIGTGVHGFCGGCHEWSDFEDEDKREMSDEEIEEIKEMDMWADFGSHTD